MSLPKPPDSNSLKLYVSQRWDSILDGWKRGWHSETAVQRLETVIEVHRKRIFEDKQVDGIYDWEADWLDAVLLHDHNTDIVMNRRAHNEDLKKMWFEWHERNARGMHDLSLEALRGMILIDGASILACLTLLSGQIATPNASAVLAAKVMLIFSVISLLMMAAGHLVGFIYANEVGSRVRGTLVGHTRHRRLYAISRYLRRYFDPAVERSSQLIYGSIGVFALSALISSLVVAFQIAN